MNHKHGLCESHPTYNTWREMKKRCNNHKCKAYPNYGGRGIEVCDEWMGNFKAFYDWSMSHGWEQGLSIDRIDNDGNYEPCNCRWVSRRVQNNNKRSNHVLEYNGQSMTIRQWADALSMNYKTLMWRIQNGWSIERALTESIKKGQMNDEGGNRSRTY